MKKKNKLISAGFTLLEILVALLIFSILSMLMIGGLHSVISAQGRTTTHALRLHQLQLTFLTMSRDIEQAVNRPVLINNGKEESAFFGNARTFTFTHLGIANSANTVARSTMARTRYSFYENYLWRITWPVLDQAPGTLSHAKRLLAANSVTFRYVDKKGGFHAVWPVEGQDNQPLPRAIEVHLNLPKWGEASQIYVLP